MARRGGSKKPWKIEILAHAGLFGYTYEVKISIKTIDGVFRPYGSVLANSYEDALVVARGYEQQFRTRGY